MRRPLAAAAVLALAAAGWYLGSPLFLTSRVDEALPGGPPIALPSGRPAPAGATPGATPAPAGAVESAASAVLVLASGKLGFVDDLHHGEGAVRLVEVAGQRILRFEGVTITNAPDVRIYLSKDAGGRYVASNAVELGALKATSGSFNYDVPAGVDLAAHRNVIVWCRAFNVLITWADLAG